MFPKVFILTMLLLLRSAAAAEARAPIVVGEGDFSITVEFRLAQGYLLSNEAPSEVSVHFVDRADGHVTDATLTLGDGLEDHAVAVAVGTLNGDEGELEITGRLYYCATDSRLCHVHMLSERQLLLRLKGGGVVARIPLAIRPRVLNLPR